MPKVNTLYGSLDQDRFDKLAEIKLLALDVDGVFSDGRIYLSNSGEELKAFHTLDGYGIKAISAIGIQVAVITGRNSRIVTDRMQSLQVKHVLQGVENKQDALAELQAKLALTHLQTAAMGDDMPDLGMFEHSTFKVSVPSGHPLVRQRADYVTQSSAGFGAVREVCDLLLQANDQLAVIHGTST